MARSLSGDSPVGESTQAQAQAQSEPQTCFVMMPYGGLHDEYFKEIYRPAIEGAGLVARRADDVYRHRTLLESMWIHVQKAVLVLVDLSGNSPNVLYELGMAHAISKPTVVLTPAAETVPIDLKALPLVTYDVRRPKWDALLKERLESELRSVLKDPDKYVLLRSAMALPPPNERVLSVDQLQARDIGDIVRQYIKQGLSKVEVLGVLSRLVTSSVNIPVFVNLEYDRIKKRLAAENGG
jgi:hypothetical protein